MKSIDIDMTSNSSDIYYDIQRLLISPSRIIPLPCQRIRSNRLIRTFGSEYQFVIVAFVDEYLHSLTNLEEISRVKYILEEGFSLFGMKYSFLFSSSSQIRRKRAYFVQGTNADVMRIRSMMYPKPNDIRIPKYANYLSLFGTSDTPTISYPFESCKIMKDIRNHKNQLLTDGSGTICQQLAQKVFDIYQQYEPSPMGATMPSALQIRYAGVKGVLVVDNNAASDITLRESMIKCDIRHSTIGIVGVAKYSDFYLNREIITLIESLHIRYSSRTNDLLIWNPILAIRLLQEDQLKASISIFHDKNAAIQAIEKYVDRAVITDVVESGIDIYSDAMWSSV